MPNFTGSLNTNEVFASLYNQIISLQVFDTGIAVNDSLYNSRKVDGTLYGDTKLFISTDVLKSYGWNHEQAPAYTLLTSKRPPAPLEQSISLDVFRQIPITVDEYLTKRAFEGEGSFVSLNSTLLSWLGKTKEVYEHTTYLANLLVDVEDKATALGTIDIKGPTGVAGYDLVRWRAQELFRVLEDAVAELNEPSRSWNDAGFLRTAKLEDFDIVIPLGVLSSVRKHDVPFLFNDDNKPLIKEVHWKYFGEIEDTAFTALGTERSLIETDYTVSGTTTHVFAGDLIPVGATVPANVAYTPSYSTRPSLATAVKIFLIHKKDYQIMSAFQVGTSFFNAQNLTTNHYLTFGHNNLAEAHLAEYPLLKLTTSLT